MVKCRQSLESWPSPPIALLYSFEQRKAWSGPSLLPWCVQEPEETPLQAAEAAKKQKSEDVDIEENKHVGQIALRKLYHESPRPIVVLYTAATCGPCRTLKPIVHGVAEEFGDKVIARLARSISFLLLSSRTFTVFLMSARTFIATAGPSTIIYRSFFRYLPTGKAEKPRAGTSCGGG